MVRGKLVDITPDKSLIKKLGASGYRLVEALGELTDNSIDARHPNRKLNIQINLKYSEKKIEVSDNASGMDFETLKHAMTLAKSGKKKERLGRFGLGLKTACSSLGRRFTIVSKPENSKQEYCCTYDERDWEKYSDSTDDSRWQINIVSRTATDFISGGTKIVIEKLKVKLYPNQTITVKQYLGRRYAQFIKKGDIQIKVNSRACKEILPTLHYEKEFSEVLPSGHKVTGWVGIKKEFSNIGDYGFNLYNQGRLIKINDKEFIPQHPAVSRIVGELNLDHVPVSFNKTAFLGDSAEYQEIKRHLQKSDGIVELIKEARKPKYASGMGDQTKDKLVQQIKATINTLPKLKTDELELEYPKTKVERKKILETDVLLDKKYRLKVFLDGWDSYKSKRVEIEDNILNITINLNSPFFYAFKGKVLPINLILAETLSSIISQESNHSAFLDLKDKLIAASFKEASESKKTIKTKKEIDIGQNEEYLSENLLLLLEHLYKKINYDFYFTGLSVLENFQNHLPRTQYYFAYCKKNRLNEFVKTIRMLKTDLIVIPDPSSEYLKNQSYLSDSNKILIVREKERDENQLRDGSVASLENAFVDLFFEIEKEKVPILKSEINQIYEGLSEMNIRNSKIKRYAKRRGIYEDIKKMIGDLK